MSDDAVREIHGVKGRRVDNTDPADVTLYESDSLIGIYMSYRDGVALTRWQARYLAAKLYRLSRRLKDREEEVA